MKKMMKSLLLPCMVVMLLCVSQSVKGQTSSLSWDLVFKNHIQNSSGRQFIITASAYPDGPEYIVKRIFEGNIPGASWQDVVGKWTLVPGLILVSNYEISRLDYNFHSGYRVTVRVGLTSKEIIVPNTNVKIVSNLSSTGELTLSFKLK